MSQDYPLATANLLGRLLEAPEQLLLFPELGRRVPEVEDKAIRELIINRIYRLIYHWDHAAISILAIIHTRQSIADMEPKPWEQ